MGLRNPGVAADTYTVGGPSEIYAGVLGELDLLDVETRSRLLEIVALAPTPELRHRRISLVRELTEHLVEDSPARWIRTIDC